MQPLRIFTQTLEAIPFVSRANVHRLAEALHLRRCHQAGMIVLVARKGQPITLDGVADETHRAVVTDTAERLHQCREIVAGKVGHQPCQLLIRS